MVLTRAYSGLQAKAGRAAGVESGAAWRAAMRAATEHGASQVILGELPAWGGGRGRGCGRGSSCGLLLGHKLQGRPCERPWAGESCLPGCVGLVASPSQGTLDVLRLTAQRESKRPPW
jgi:hypothetical protein